jgi:hypothetical protein
MIPSHQVSCLLACNIGCSEPPLYKTWEIMSEHHEYQPLGAVCSSLQHRVLRTDFFAYRKTRPKIISECHESQQVPYVSIHLQHRVLLSANPSPTHLQHNTFYVQGIQLQTIRTLLLSCSAVYQTGWMVCGDRKLTLFGCG